MKHLERWRAFLRNWKLVRCWLGNRRKFNFPLVIRIVNVTAGFADDEAADLVSTQICSLQHVNHFTAEQLTDTFAHLRRLNAKIHAILEDCLDDFFFTFARLDVALQKRRASLASRARHLRHDAVLDLEGDFLQVQKIQSFVEEWRVSSIDRLRRPPKGSSWCVVLKGESINLLHNK